MNQKPIICPSCSSEHIPAEDGNHYCEECAEFNRSFRAFGMRDHIDSKGKLSNTTDKQKVES